VPVQFVGPLAGQNVGNLFDVLVSSSGQALCGKRVSQRLRFHIGRAVTHHDDVSVFWQSLGDLNGSPDSVSGLQGRDDTLKLSAQSECTESLLISCNNVLGSARVLQPSVLRSNSLNSSVRNETSVSGPIRDSRRSATDWVVQTGGNGMSLHDLTGRRLQQVGSYSMQDTGLSESQGGRVSSGLNTWKGSGLAISYRSAGAAK